jgi:PHAX RNA-binding domain
MIEEQTEQLPQRHREPSQAETAAMIADALGETEEGVRQSIVLIVKALGRTQSRQLLNFALQAEEHGGMMLPSGSRRRTVGGIFFHYVHTLGIPKPGKSLPRPQNPNQKAKKPNEQAVTPKNTNNSPKASEKPFSWDDRIAAIKEAEQEKGTVSTVKITVVGRPGKILDKGQFIVTVMESSKVPALPKGLPTPTNVATKYAVYISSKQWKKVEEAIKDPDDVLIVEGFPKTDPEVSAIAVFATNVTTKKLQAAAKQAKVS